MAAPGKSHREGISLFELTEMFPDEASAVEWFKAIRWPDGRHCPRCGSVNTRDIPNTKPMPYWCRDCKSYFSVRTGTTIEKSRLDQMTLRLLAPLEDHGYILPAHLIPDIALGKMFSW